jgi:hypothetical protein
MPHAHQTRPQTLQRGTNPKRTTNKPAQGRTTVNTNVETPSFSPLSSPLADQHTEPIPNGGQVHAPACLGIRDMPLLPFLGSNIASVLLPYFQLQGNPEVLVGREPTRKPSRQKEEHEGDRKQEIQRMSRVSGLGVVAIAIGHQFWALYRMLTDFLLERCCLFQRALTRGWTRNER